MSLAFANSIFTCLSALLRAASDQPLQADFQEANGGTNHCDRDGFRIRDHNEIVRPTVLRILELAEPCLLLFAGSGGRLHQDPGTLFVGKIALQ